MKYQKYVLSALVCSIFTTSSFVFAASEITLPAQVQKYANTFKGSSHQRFLTLARENPTRIDQLIQHYRASWSSVFLYDSFANLNDFEAALKKDAQKIKHVDSTLYTKLPLPSYTNNDFESKWAELSKTLGKEDILTTDSLLGQLSEKRWVAPNGVRVIETKILRANGEPALFEMRYNPESKTIIFQRAYLRQAPAWVLNIPFIPGKGMPTAMYMRLYQMRVLGIPYGGAQHVTLYKVEHLESIARLDWLKRQYPNRGLGWLYAQIQKDQYLTMVLALTGHILKSAYTFSAGGMASLQIFARRESNFEGEESSQQNRFDQILQRYGLTRDSRVKAEFNATAPLAPLR